MVRIRAVNHTAASRVSAGIQVRRISSVPRRNSPEIQGTIMRALLVAAFSAALLWSLPAAADHWHIAPYFGFGIGVGGPYPYHGYGPHIGVGVHVGGPYYPGPPPPAGPAPQPAQGAAQGALKLYVYPSAGQSETQIADDRYQCHTWAAGQSGYDPTLGAGSRDEADGYTRAFTACMEARNYVVR
jgi:hypothetical protein